MESSLALYYKIPYFNYLKHNLMWLGVVWYTSTRIWLVGPGNIYLVNFVIFWVCSDTNSEVAYEIYMDHNK